jgi:Collagenase NC10 and Endostatin
MGRAIVLSVTSITLLGSAALLAQAQQPPAAPPAVISFFVAENPNQTGNLGGLAGADQMCQQQAQALGAPHAARTWRAYLSQEQRGNTPRVNARDRIGPGPWFNVKGVLVASNVADLHGDQQRDRNNMQKANVLDAKGNPVPGVERPQGTQNEHDILTGSDPQGRAYTDGLDHTCGNWTSDGLSLPAANPNFPSERARAMLGHSDRSGGGNVSWNSTHMSQGCNKQALNATGGTGRFYCFASN